ncbi:MAG: hypothetical protein EPO26_10565 [Chloroflexota bacterium]|nr:MAG: hypothetical protein EPO26_10565 [Chloroflexota bacterium]
MAFIPRRPTGKETFLAAAIAAILSIVVALSASIIATPILEGQIQQLLPDPGMLPIVFTALGICLLGAFLARALFGRSDATRIVGFTCIVLGVLTAMPALFGAVPGLIYVTVPRNIIVGLMAALLLPRLLLRGDDQGMFS